MNGFELKHGSIYLNEHIVNNLAFILTIDKDDGTTNLYKFGDSIYMSEHIDKLAPLSNFITVISFSFGEYGDEVISKGNQIKIIEYMRDYTLSNLTRELGSALLSEDYEKVNKVFNEMINLK